MLFPPSPQKGLLHCPPVFLQTLRWSLMRNLFVSSFSCSINKNVSVSGVKYMSPFFWQSVESHCCVCWWCQSLFVMLFLWSLHIMDKDFSNCMASSSIILTKIYLCLKQQWLIFCLVFVAVIRGCNKKRTSLCFVCEYKKKQELYISILTLEEFVFVLGNRLRLFWYVLFQMYFATIVDVGMQEQQIGGNVWMLICVWTWICVRNIIPRLSSDHTDSLPSPAVPPDTHILTTTFLHSEAWWWPCCTPAPIAKRWRGSGGTPLLWETNRPSK